jgi:hypothetical protein
MPWQRQVCDVAFEIYPDTWEWCYPTVVLQVQRQAGKTTLIESAGVHRGLTGEDRGVWYTAQSRQDARDNLMTFIKRVRRSLFKAMVKIRESNGSESITFPTGSEYRIFAPVDDALHGKATHLVTVDEAWAFDEEHGDALLQAIVPTFTTVPGQILIPSAAGTSSSTWLRGLVDAGRMMVDAGRRDTVAYFEWGIGDDVDPADLGAVALAHPGYGYTLRPNGLIHAAATLKSAEFARAYGGRWTGAGERAIPALLWSTAPDAAAPVPARFGVAFDVAIDSADAAVAIAWRDQLGRAHVELADVRDGVAWLVGRLVDLAVTHDLAGLAYDHIGPAADASDPLRRAMIGKGIELRQQLIEPTGLTTDQYLAACAGFLNELVAGTLKYRPHPALDAAAAAAVKRPVGDRWAWGRRASGGTIAPLVASTVALWAFDHAPEPPAPFRIR